MIQLTKLFVSILKQVEWKGLSLMLAVVVVHINSDS